VDRMADTRNAHRIQLGKSSCKCPVRTPTRRCEDIIKNNLRNVGMGMDGTGSESCPKQVLILEVLNLPVLLPQCYVGGVQVSVSLHVRNSCCAVTYTTFNVRPAGHDRPW
jgi:hypothetical protein